MEDTFINFLPPVSSLDPTPPRLHPPNLSASQPRAVRGLQYRATHTRRRQAPGRDGDPGVRRLMAGVVRCLDTLPVNLGTRFASLVVERVLKDTREGEPSAAVTILVGLLASKFQAVHQV